MAVDYRSDTLYTGSSSHNGVNVRVKYSYTQDYQLNQTTITATLQNRRENTAWTSHNDAAPKYVQQDGTTKVYGTGFDVSGYTAGQWYDILTGSWTIDHNTDGTKSITLKGVLETGVTPGTLTCSSNVNLHQIPVGSLRVKVNNAWKRGTPYVKVNGTWKRGAAYIKTNGVWKNGA